MADGKPSLAAALDLPPADALAAFRARDRYAVSVSWRDVEPENHARVFTAAKIAQLDLLGTLKASLDGALARGETFAAWREQILPALQKAGWWGEVRDAELTGTAEPVFVGERRLTTIFRTNMRVSAAAGQWRRIQSLKDVRPFLLYDAVNDRRTRPLHRAWDGIVLPVDHPFWLTHFPPNGWNCRCSVIQLSQRDLDRRGLSVAPDDRLPSLDPVGRAYIGPRGEGGDRPLRPVLPGIDPGWDQNVGANSLAGIIERAAASIRAARDAGLAEQAARLLDEIAAVLGDELAAVLRALVDGAHVAAAALLVDAARRGGRGRSSTSAKLSAVAKLRRREGGRFAMETQMGRHARDALQTPNRQNKHDLGPVNRSAVEKIATDAKQDVAGFRVSAHDDQLRHAYLDHQSVKKEAAYDQRVLTPADLDRAELVLAKPDSAQRSPKQWRGNPAMLLERRFGREVQIVVVAKATGRGELQFATTYVKVDR